MKVLILPKEFSEVFRLRPNDAFAPFARTIREGDQLVVRVGLEDYDEDDLVIAASEELLVVLGSRPPASFCIHLFIPSHAVLKDIEARIEERVLVIKVPLAGH
jgi:HSP20 family molecular chaperone IbpA